MEQTAEIEIVTPGVLEVLSVGKGDLKLSWDPGDEAKARETIEEMLRKGYTIFVETENGTARVKRFDPKHMAYVIAAVHEHEDEAQAATSPKETGKKVGEREVPVAGSKATAVGKTAGG